MAMKPRSIDEYLAGLSEENRGAGEGASSRTCGGTKGEESISYGMPTFRLKGKLIAGFKAAANNCSFHPMSGTTLTIRKHLDRVLTIPDLLQSGFTVVRGTVTSELLFGEQSSPQPNSGTISDSAPPRIMTPPIAPRPTCHGPGRDCAFSRAGRPLLFRA